MDWLYAFDKWFASVANALLCGAGGFFTPLLKAVTFSGNGGAVFIILSLVMLFSAKTRKAGMVSLTALLFGVIITNLLLKNIVARPRPFTDSNSLFYGYWVQAGSLTESGYSFPSGHTTAAAAFGAALFLSFRKRYSWVAFSIPMIMGFSRIYFGVHYATDVLGGMIVGSVCAVRAVAVAALLIRNSKLRRFFQEENNSLLRALKI